MNTEATNGTLSDLRILRKSRGGPSSLSMTMMYRLFILSLSSSSLGLKPNSFFAAAHSGLWHME